MQIENPAKVLMPDHIMFGAAKTLGLLQLPTCANVRIKLMVCLRYPIVIASIAALQLTNVRKRRV
jgi:hypothetical protein